MTGKGMVTGRPVLCKKSAKIRRVQGYHVLVIRVCIVCVRIVIKGPRTKDKKP